MKNVEEELKELGKKILVDIAHVLQTEIVDKYSNEIQFYLIMMISMYLAKTSVKIYLEDSDIKEEIISKLESIEKNLHIYEHQKH